MRVVAAVIQARGRLLISRRHPGGPRGGKWEFPGGKVEPGESDAEALRREVREELGCEVAVGALIARHTHRYPDLEVELSFHRCEVLDGGMPRCLGMAALEWAEPDRITEYDFCEADLPILDAVRRAIA